MIDIEIDNKLKTSGYKAFIEMESINHESIERELDSTSLDFVKAMFEEQRAINEQLMENNKLLVEEIKEIKQSYKESENKENNVI
ncbi:hypothetical protein GYH73_028545 [Bacillus megaterium]|nr:hypothetical protein [Priestia megaterium]NEW04266.1 hypothetical protein [Priestia megaterium]